MTSAPFRHVSPVGDDDLGTLAAELDPTAPGGGRHLNFDVILRRCGHAWMALLTELGSFGQGVIVPRLEVDYHREVGVGDLVVDVAVLHVGRTSFRLGLDVRQHGELAARAEVVLVVFDYPGKQTLPLTAPQRAGLDRYRPAAA